jgi:hypothetical protein
MAHHITLGNFTKMVSHFEVHATRSLRVDDLKELQAKIALRGGRLVAFSHVVSFGVACVRDYKVQWLSTSSRARLYGALHSLVPLTLGWWSMRGPFWTVTAIVWNFRGGYDLTGELAKHSSPGAITISYDQSRKFESFLAAARSAALKILALFAGLFAFWIWWSVKHS